MSAKDTPPPNPARRRLLTAAPLAGAGLAIGATPVEAAEAPEDPREPLYRETEHVRTYYQRARG